MALDDQKPLCLALPKEDFLFRRSVMSGCGYGIIYAAIRPQGADLTPLRVSTWLVLSVLAWVGITVIIKLGCRLLPLCGWWTRPVVAISALILAINYPNRHWSGWLVYLEPPILIVACISDYVTEQRLLREKLNPTLPEV